MGYWVHNLFKLYKQLDGWLLIMSLYDSSNDNEFIGQVIFWISVYFTIHMSKLVVAGDDHMLHFFFFSFSSHFHQCGKVATPECRKCWFCATWRLKNVIQHFSLFSWRAPNQNKTWHRSSSNFIIHILAGGLPVIFFTKQNPTLPFKNACKNLSICIFSAWSPITAGGNTWPSCQLKFETDPIVQGLGWLFFQVGFQLTLMTW